MPDLRPAAVPILAARLMLAAVLSLLLGLAVTSSAHAADFGELSAFGALGAEPDQFQNPGPIAVDPSDANSLYVADIGDFNTFGVRVRKFSQAGVQQAVIAPQQDDNPTGGLPYIAGMAVDASEHRLYVLMGAGVPDQDLNLQPTSFKVRVYSTVAQGGALVAPADLPSGVLVDFTAAGSLENPTGIAVDPSSHKVVVLGTDTFSQPDPKAVLQYVTDAGALSTRTEGLGAALDSNAPMGLAIAPDGAVFIPAPGLSGVDIHRIPAGGGAATLFATDPAGNAVPAVFFGSPNGFATGNPIAISPDGATVYLAEVDFNQNAEARAFSTVDGAPGVRYGGGETVCDLSQGLLGIAAGSDGVVATTSFYAAAGDTVEAVHVFGPGGSGCPIPQALYTAAGKSDPTITVQKGSSVHFDGAVSDLHGATPVEVDWDLDGSGDFATHTTGTPADLTLDHTFLQVGTITVGMKLHLTGSSTGIDPPPVFHTIKVTAPAPTAVFTASNRNPGPGGTVSFDASGSVDPTGSATGGSTHTLTKYHWEFGDGAVQDTTVPTVTHAFANGGTAALVRTVRLVVSSADGGDSAAVSQTITVGAAAVQPPPPPPGTPETPKTPDPPKQVVNTPPATTLPSPGVSGSTVDAKGVLALKVTCPAGGDRCEGTIVLTAKVTTTVKGHKKTKTITLGTAKFAVAAGKSQALKLHVSSAGRSLLRKSHKLSASAKVTVSGGGKSKSQTKSLSLKPAKASPKHH
jgi:hypothetical protein